MDRFHISLSLDGTKTAVGAAMSYAQAERICNDIYNALVDELGTRVSVYVENDT